MGVDKVRLTVPLSYVIPLVVIHRPVHEPLFIGLSIYREPGGEGRTIDMPVAVRPAVGTYDPYGISSCHKETTYEILGCST